MLKEILEELKREKMFILELTALGLFVGGMIAFAVLYLPKQSDFDERFHFKRGHVELLQKKYYAN